LELVQKPHDVVGRQFDQHIRHFRMKVAAEPTSTGALDVEEQFRWPGSLTPV